jgi:hypothetical protein
MLLDNLITYLAEFSSETEVITRIENLLERFESILSVDPFAVARSPSLVELGVVDFREFHLDSFRLIFRINENNHSIIVDVISQQKQNLEQLLIQYCLLKK